MPCLDCITQQQYTQELIDCQKRNRVTKCEQCHIYSICGYKNL